MVATRYVEGSVCELLCAAYRANIPQFSCPCCLNGEMRPARISDSKEFQRADGQILVGGNLAPRLYCPFLAALAKRTASSAAANRARDLFTVS